MWRAWNAEQRVAAVGATLLIVSAIGPFSWVEVAMVLVGVSVLLLLRRRAQGRPFHLPFGDGIVIAAAGAWAALLILIRLFDRPLGQGMLALACAALLLAAGIRERARRPMDDLPREQDTLWEERPARRRRPPREPPLSPSPDDPTRALPADEEATMRLPAQKELPGMDDPNPYEVPRPKDPPAPDDLPAGRG
ncbi:MAG TPA: hypothetical protein VD790_00405 [Thermoleophilaceae bacterium]|nr:hypothetical protein [Thermoleophilaceae bacterium]